MFYDVYCQLCEKHNEQPYKLAVKLGAKTNSVVAQWAKGSTPRGPMLQKIADYFNVSVQYLLSGESAPPEEAKQTAQADGLSDAEINFLRELRMLSPEDQRDIFELARLLIAQRKSKDSP